MPQPVKLHLLPPDHSGPVVVSVTIDYGADARHFGGPELTSTLGGNTRMAYHDGTLYLSMVDQHAPLTAADHDRAAALGYLFEGYAAPFPTVISNRPDEARNRETLNWALREYLNSPASDVKRWIEGALPGWRADIVTHICPEMWTVIAHTPTGQTRRVKVPEDMLMYMKLHAHERGLHPWVTRIVVALQKAPDGSTTTL